MTTYVNDDVYPYQTVVYIEARFGNDWITGSGVLVGRNDVLTASHVVYEPFYGLADEIRVSFSYDPSQPGADYEAANVEYFNDFDPDGDGSLLIGDGFWNTYGGSEVDIALLTMDQPFGDTYGWLGMDFEFISGQVNATGHPSVYNDFMTNDSGPAFHDDVDNSIDISALEINPGNSGGPVWYDSGDGGYVVGVVSTGLAAASLAAHETWLMEAIADNDRLLNGGRVFRGDSGDNAFQDVASGGTYYGEGGIDTIFLPAARQVYQVDLANSGVVTVESASGPDFTLVGMERVVLGDGILLFGLGSPNAPAAYRLYGGAFDRTPDEDGFLFWTHDWLDQGRTLHDAALGFIQSREFVQLYGNSLSNAEFVDQLYLNVLDRQGEAAGVAFWNDYLADRTGDRADVLVNFTQLPEYVRNSSVDIDNGYWVV